MKVLALTILAALTFAFAARTQAANDAAPTPIELALIERDGETLCTLRARAIRIDELIARLASATGRTLQGVPAGDLRVDVDLQERPLAYVVQMVLGSAGLRARLTPNLLELARENGGDAAVDPTELDEQGELAWRRALRVFPEHELAARAERELASLQESRGNRGAARVHYDNLVRNHPESTFVPLALYEAGLALAAIGEWSGAAERFSKLANLAQSHDYQAPARLELARCFAHKGDGGQALTLLDALDHLFPAQDNADTVERLYVRALASSAAGQHARALELLDQAGSLAIERAQEQEALRMRADALEHIGLANDAARAWLAWSARAPALEREAALLRAARLAREAGDSVGVLFVAKQGRGTGVEAELEGLARAAREELGLNAEQHDVDASARLHRARELVALGSTRQALVVLEPLFRSREVLARKEAHDVALLYARALDAERGLDQALDLLRDVARTQSELDLRKELYLLAGELCERRDQWERAAAAYGGRL